MESLLHRNHSFCLTWSWLNISSPPIGSLDCFPFPYKNQGLNSPNHKSKPTTKGYLIQGTIQHRTLKGRTAGPSLSILPVHPLPPALPSLGKLGYMVQMSPWCKDGLPVGLLLPDYLLVFYLQMCVHSVAGALFRLVQTPMRETKRSTTKKKLGIPPFKSCHFTEDPTPPLDIRNCLGVSKPGCLEGPKLIRSVSVVSIETIATLARKP